MCIRDRRRAPENDSRTEKLQMPRRLENKITLITGAGMGMGREAALLFAREGARVVVADLNGQAAAETVDQVKRAGGEALATVGDVAVEAEVKRMVEEGVRRFGALHVLYNNAGVLWKDRDRSVLELSLIHISEPTRLLSISYAVFCLKKKKKRV